MKIEDVVIIGAGPAGIATAIQLRRSGINPLILERSHVGGLLANANCVENYPGFAEGLPGIALVEYFKQHLAKVGAKVDFEEAIHLDYTDAFVIETSKRQIQSKMVVIASGTHPREIGIPVEAPDRVFHEIAPIADVTGKHVAVIGAGDAAFDYALNLSRHNRVTLLNRGQTVKCLPLLQQRVSQNSRIAYQENVKVIAAKSLANGMVILRGQAPMGGWELGVDYVIFAIGREVQLDYLVPCIKGQISHLKDSGLLYFVGDVKNDIFRQTSIAVGDGVGAAMQIHQKIQETG